ncbi:MAG TPA: N-acyl homoserine lactonase family protein [Gaiellaceae bacterium]|nr:N-acyl homoserine lactonase family protein [Gaiellaceae bacterium]
MTTPDATADWLAILDYGTFEVAEDGRRIPILGYVVRSGAHVVLVDTGFPAAYVEDAEAAGRRDGLVGFGRLVAIGPENRPESQLALLGLGPFDVTELVVTHGDVDHVGGLHDFPHATIVVSRSEREAGRPRYFGDARPLAWPDDATYRLVEGDEELVPGLELLSTPGHSPGQLSLLVRLRESGAVVLAGDAISRERELATGINGGASDVERARRSARRLVGIARAQRALLVYGHDPEQRRTLRFAPDVYR